MGEGGEIREMAGLETLDPAGPVASRRAMRATARLGAIGRHEYLKAEELTKASQASRCLQEELKDA